MGYSDLQGNEAINAVDIQNAVDNGFFSATGLSIGTSYECLNRDSCGAYINIEPISGDGTELAVKSELIASIITVIFKSSISTNVSSGITQNANYSGALRLGSTFSGSPTSDVASIAFPNTVSNNNVIVSKSAIISFTKNTYILVYSFYNVTIDDLGLHKITVYVNEVVLTSFTINFSSNINYAGAGSHDFGSKSLVNGDVVRFYLEKIVVNYVSANAPVGQPYIIITFSKPVINDIIVKLVVPQNQDGTGITASVSIHGGSNLTSYNYYPDYGSSKRRCTVLSVTPASDSTYNYIPSNS